MFRKIVASYTDSFKGLSREIWWLALITLVNRAGTMVVPFLTLYLTKSRGFSLTEVSLIMVCFGAGSVSGSYIGGYLTDKFGAYKTMVFSLSSSGLFFILLQYMNTPLSVGIFVFTVLLLADIFRPAMFVGLRAYSQPENQTRSLTLIRLALNLGFSVGPVMAGILIYNWGYSSLFWVDGLSCFAATGLLLYVLNPKRAYSQKEETVEQPKSPYSDKKYLVFCFGLVLYGFVFLQYFSTVPLFFRDVFKLNEQTIGLLLGFNGLLVFLLEMPLIHAIDKRKLDHMRYILIGMVLLLLSFLIMVLVPNFFILWFAIVLMSLAEMLIFPLSNAYASKRAKKGKMGQYMALYSMSFSISHLFGHSAGLQMIHRIDFYPTWWVLIGFCALGIIVFAFISKKDQSTLGKKS